MKCIVIETSPERINAKPVTNEDGSAHVYATISEARAELKANGYSYNRENQRYYINGTEYRAYIIREDSEEYADAITTAEAHNRAAAALINAYAEAIGDDVTEDDPEAIAAHRVARACIGLTTATDDDRATVSAMVEAIADRARETAAFRANQAANSALRNATSAYDEIERHHGNWQGWTAQYIAQAQQSAAEAERLAVAASDKTITAKVGAVSAMTRRVREEIAAAAPIYQRHELLAYLGDPDAYDVDAIEAEATRFTADGARVWAAFGEDLAAIAERHEIVTYYAI